MELALVILLSLAGLATIADWLRQPRRTVRLRILSLHYPTKPKDPMTTNLRSPVTQFAQIQLVPVDANGAKVKLDADAIVAEVISGGGRASVQVLDDEDGGRRFLVNLIPSDTPGENVFRVRGDAQPGEGAEILEEEFIYTATPANAVSLGATVTYLPKSSIPA